MKRNVVLACIVALMPGIALAAKAVLLVDGHEITDQRLESAKRAMAAQMQGRDVPADAMLRLAVDQVIGQTLLVEAAREAGIKAPPEAVEAAIDRQRQALGGAKAFAARLQQAGLTEADVREMETERLEIQKFVETKIVPTITVADADLEAYYKEHPDEFKHDAQIHLLQVLVAAQEGALPEQRDAARKRAEQALQRLQAGEEFAKVASEFSDDPSKARGGEVGWVRKGMLLPELEPAVSALEDGQLSGVLESPRGFHIFKVVGHRGPGTYPLDEIRPMLKQMLAQREVGSAIAKFVGERRQTASILALDPTLEPLLAQPTGDSAKPTP